MFDQSLQQSKSYDSRSVIQEFVGAAALLVAVAVVSTILEAVFVAFETVATATADSATRSVSGSTDRVTFAVSVAGLGATVVGVGSLLFRERSDSFDSLHGSDLVTMSGVIGLVLFVLVYIFPGAFDTLFSPITLDLLGPATMGGLAIGYLQYRDAPIQIALPDIEKLPTIIGVGVVAVTAGSGTVILNFLARDTVFVSFVRPGVGALDILVSIGTVGILGGAGFGLLYNAAIQSRLRSVMHPAHAVVAVTTLLAVRSWASPELQLLIGPGQRRASTSPVGPSIAVTIVGIIVGIAAAWVFARGMQTLSQEIDRDVTPLLAGAGVVCIITLAVSIASVIRGYGIGFVWGVGSLSAVGAAGSIGFERTRSVWAPALAFGTYWLLVDSALTRLLMGLIG